MTPALPWKKLPSRFSDVRHAYWPAETPGVSVRTTYEFQSVVPRNRMFASTPYTRL